MSRVFEAFGLAFDSDIECPELPASSAAADVTIRYGSVPSHLDEPLARGTYFEVSVDQFLFNVESVGRYLVQRGSAITIDRALGATDREVQTLLFGSILSALLRQRGVLALHAAAVATPCGAVLFAGHSGSGKSTLLAALVARGCRMLADDLTAITLDAGGVPLVHPSVPYIRLWADAACRLGHSTTGLPNVWPSMDKYVFPASSAYAASSQPLSGIYILRVNDAAEISIERQSGAERFVVLREHTCNWRFAGLGNHAKHFSVAATVVNRVPIQCVSRPRTPFLLDDLVDRILRDLGRCEEPQLGLGIGSRGSAAPTGGWTSAAEWGIVQAFESPYPRA